MNMKNLAMWAVIVFLTIGLYNMFKNPQGSMTQKNNLIFSYNIFLNINIRKIKDAKAL